MIGNSQGGGQDDPLSGLLGRRRRRGGRDPLAEALDRWLDWLEPPSRPKPWCGSTPSRDDRPPAGRRP